MGIGCSGMLMCPITYAARTLTAARFALWSGLIQAVGNTGMLLSASPLACWWNGRAGAPASGPRLPRGLLAMAPVALCVRESPPPRDTTGAPLGGRAGGAVARPARRRCGADGLRLRLPRGGARRARRLGRALADGGEGPGRGSRRATCCCSARVARRRAGAGGVRTGCAATRPALHGGQPRPDARRSSCCSRPAGLAGRSGALDRGPPVDLRRGAAVVFGLFISFQVLVFSTARAMVALAQTGHALSAASTSPFRGRCGDAGRLGRGASAAGVRAAALCSFAVALLLCTRRLPVAPTGCWHAAACRGEMKRFRSASGGLFRPQRGTTWYDLPRAQRAPPLRDTEPMRRIALAITCVLTLLAAVPAGAQPRARRRGAARGGRVARRARPGHGKHRGSPRPQSRR